MSDPEILAALTPVVEVLESLGVTYFIGGSVASSAYGIARASLDVDLVADLHAEHVRPFVLRLQDAYYVEEERINDSIGRRRSFNVIHLATMLKIDIFLPKQRPYDQEAQRRARQDALEEGEGARLFSLASPEDVVLSKLEWYRAGGQTSERQWADVIGVLKASGPTLERTYLARWAASLGVLDLLDRALLEAGPHHG